MTDTAATQLNRIVGLVADLSRRESQGESPVALAELAQQHGTTPHQIQQDVRALTLLGDDPSATWLLSLCIAQEGDRMLVSSRGPFRRPVRLTGQETLALRVALATDKGGADIAQHLTSAPPDLDPPFRAGPIRGRQEHTFVDVLLAAINGRRATSLLYAGAGARDATHRIVEPHQVVSRQGWHYLVAWCRRVDDWRHFRIDRVLELELTEERFDARADFQPLEREDQVFAGGHDADRVRVRFSAKIARWLKERYPRGEPGPHDSWIVTFEVVSAEWLVRTVLQYGSEAEILEPESYRAAMRGDGD